MADSADFNEWLRQLECPEAYTSNYVKEKLYKGVLGLLWEDLTRFIRPHPEVAEARKNILLYKLKNEPKDASIQNIRNTIQIQRERTKLDAKIKDAEERWRQQEFVCRQKANLLEKKKTERKALEKKKEILKIKHQQMQVQIEDCAKMQEICNHLMPPTVEEVPQSTINDCLSLVSNYSGGSEKRKVLNTVSESLGRIKIPVLWNALLAARSHYTDYLIHLDIEDNKDSSTKGKSDIDAGIARICSEHLDNVAKSFVQNSRIRNNEVTTMNYVEKIEQSLKLPELTNWLSLALEVRKLEILQTELRKEVEKLEEQLPEDNITIDDRLAQLISEIKAMDSKTLDCVHEIQKALGLLRSSRTLITKTKEALFIQSENLQLLQKNEEKEWHHIDLNTELNTFQESIDINALRKIMIKGDVGSYKHLSACFNNAPLIVGVPNKSKSVSNFPMLRVPVYYLLDLYKAFVASASLNKQINEVISHEDETPESPIDTPTTVVYPYSGLLELLRLADVRCNSTVQHSQEFDQVLKTWSNQTVREVVSKIFSDETVHGATLDEWQNKFSMIVYVLQKSNINVA